MLEMRRHSLSPFLFFPPSLFLSLFLSGGWEDERLQKEKVGLFIVLVGRLECPRLFFFFPLLFSFFLSGGLLA